MRSRFSRALVALSSIVFVSASGCAASAPSGGEPAVEPPGSTSSSPVAAPPPSVAEPVTSAAASASPPSPSASAAAADPPHAVAELPDGLKILIIGDSFAEALGVGMKAREGEYHVKATLRGEKATFIPEWAGPNRGVPLILKQVQPSLVVIALGGNELAMTDPSVRGPKVKQLVDFMGTIPCIWVSPPLWGNKDNGLLEVIRKNSSPCRYFDSNVLSPNLPRGGDKIHPSAEGQKIWAGFVLDWVKKERDPKAPSFALAPRPASE